jgi:hypothetical protein
VAQDYNDIYSIVERLRILEEGLDKNQKSVNQLGPTFKPKTVAVLTAKTDPKNPLAGKLVGGSESEENEKAVLEAEMAEDVLEKVKKSFTDFIKHVEDEIKDSDIKEKNKEDTDLKKKELKHRDLIAKETPVAEDPTEEEPISAPTDTEQYPVMPESAPVKTMTMEDGSLFEIHGNEHDGFEIRREGRCMKSRFENVDHATMALEMFMHRLKKQDESQDYMEER